MEGFREATKGQRIRLSSPECNGVNGAKVMALAPSIRGLYSQEAAVQDNRDHRHRAYSDVGCGGEKTVPSLLPSTLDNSVFARY